MFHVLAEADPSGLAGGGIITATGVLLALKAGWLCLPGERDVWKDRATIAESALTVERDKVDALNAVTREQVVPAIVAMTAATVEATRELRRGRTTPASARSRGKAAP